MKPFRLALVLLLAACAIGALAVLHIGMAGSSSRETPRITTQTVSMALFGLAALRFIGNIWSLDDDGLPFWARLVLSPFLVGIGLTCLYLAWLYACLAG